MCDPIVGKSWSQKYNSSNRDFSKKIPKNKIINKKWNYQKCKILMPQYISNSGSFAYLPFDRISMCMCFQFHYVNLPHWSISRLTYHHSTYNRKLKSRFIWFFWQMMALTENIQEFVDKWNKPHWTWYFWSYPKTFLNCEEYSICLNKVILFLL